jgi:hypothetical protein
MSLWKKISLGVLIFLVLLLGTVGSWWGRPPACIWCSKRRIAGFRGWKSAK